MKKYMVFFLIVICMAGLTGCSGGASASPCAISFTVPAGSHDIIFASEQLYFGGGKATISADYEAVGTHVLSVWLADTSIEHAYEGNPYSNAFISPNSTVELEVDDGKWYEIGILLTNESASDIPVVITVLAESWRT